MLQRIRKISVHACTFSAIVCSKIEANSCDRSPQINNGARAPQIGRR